jgi:hypothetical protein
MPAGSEVTLPHTWRPFGVRMAAIGFGVMLLFVCAFAWFALPADIRASFTLFQRGTLLALGGMVLAVGFALVRCRLVATEQGLTVVNGYRRRDLAWAEVDAINLPQGAPWAVLDLADGTTCAVLAIQGSDGSRARRDLAQVRALLA